MQGIVSFLLSALLLLLAHPLAAELYGSGEELDEIVAVVNEDVIVRSELEGAKVQVLAQVAEQGMQRPPDSVIERQTLERLILTKLQLAEAERAGITVSDEILAQAIGDIASKNGLTVAQLRNALAAEGMDFAAFRENIREQILLSRLRKSQVVDRIKVTDAEVDAFLTRNAGVVGTRSDVRLLHILLATPQGASAEQIAGVRAKAEDIVTQLRGGADFRQMAIRVSDSRQAIEGGDLGWLKVGQVPSLFAEAALTMDRGEIEGPLRNPSGFHIIKLEDLKGGASRQVITQTHARHILIRTSEVTSDTDARTRLEQLRERIIGGDDFNALARSHSDDKASALKGGDLGWVSPGDLVPEFEEAMDALQANQVSPPFRTQFGWHIVQVLERRQHDSTEEVLRNEARRALQERKSDEAEELYLRRLRDEAYVELRLPDQG